MVCSHDAVAVQAEPYLSLPCQCHGRLTCYPECGNTIHNAGNAAYSVSVVSLLWHCCLHALCLPHADPYRPKFIEISPYYPPEGGPETNPVIMAAMDVMHATYLPKGIDDAGRWYVPWR